MKREMDIVRKIIIQVNDSNKPLSSIEGVKPDVFAYHAQILNEAGLLIASVNGNGVRPATSAVIHRLTWSGHDFADSIRDDTIWNKAKNNVMKPMASWSFSILIKYIETEISRQITSG